MYQMINLEVGFKLTKILFLAYIFVSVSCFLLGSLISMIDILVFQSERMANQGTNSMYFLKVLPVW